MNVVSAYRAIVIGVVSSLTVVTPTPVRADPILFQSVPTFDASPQVFYCSSCGGVYSTFDQFTLSQNSTISKITFGEYAEEPPYFPISSMTANIFSLSHTLLFSQAFTAGQITNEKLLVPGTDQVTYTTQIVSISPMALSLASGSYLISFYGFDLAPATYSTGANLGFQTYSVFPADPNASVEFSDFTTGFILEGTRVDAVPGPIVGAGLPALVLTFGGVLAWWRRRRQKFG